MSSETYDFSSALLKARECGCSGVALVADQISTDKSVKRRMVKLVIRFSNDHGSDSLGYMEKSGGWKYLPSDDLKEFINSEFGEVLTSKKWIVFNMTR